MHQGISEVTCPPQKKHINDRDMRIYSRLSATCVIIMLMAYACGSPSSPDGSTEDTKDPGHTGLSVTLPKGGYVYPDGKILKENMLSFGFGDDVPTVLVITSTKKLGVPDVYEHYSRAYASWEQLTPWDSSEVFISHRDGQWASWKSGDTYCIISATSSPWDETVISHSFVAEDTYKIYTKKRERPTEQENKQ